MPPFYRACPDESRDLQHGGYPRGYRFGFLRQFHYCPFESASYCCKSLVHPQELAEEACHIELDILREPIGKQDQFIAAYGGITCFEFRKNEPVRAFPVRISEETLYSLEDNLLLFFTGYSRSASAILKDQDERTRQDDEEIIENLHFVKELGFKPGFPIWRAYSIKSRRSPLPQEFVGGLNWSSGG